MPFIPVISGPGPRLGAALRLIALVGFAEIAAIAIFIVSVMALAVGFGAAP